MADVINSPNMNLPVPVVTTDFGPDWANNLNSCLGAIDSHNHTSGQGVAIPPSGLNINVDLPMGGNSLTQAKSVVFTAQPSLATLQAVYVIGVDLYYNDGSGNVVRITQGGNVTGSTGTITGLPSGTASASFQSGTGTFQFQSSTNTPANITGATVYIAEQTASPNKIGLKSPTALGASYDLTMPGALPGSTQIMQLSSAGAISAALTVDNSTLQISGTNLLVKDSGITGAKLNSNVVDNSTLQYTSSQLSIKDGGVINAKIQDNPSFGGNRFGSSSGGNQIYAQTDTYQIGGGSSDNCLVLGPVYAGMGMRVLSGKIKGSDGSILAGQGFTAARNSTGAYTITPSISATASIIITGTASCVDAGAGNLRVASMGGGSTSAITVGTRNGSGTAVDNDFHFVIVVSA